MVFWLHEFGQNIMVLGACGGEASVKAHGSQEAEKM
jgi:hypothetical protein